MDSIGPPPTLDGANITLSHPVRVATYLSHFPAREVNDMTCFSLHSFLAHGFVPRIHGFQKVKNSLPGNRYISQSFQKVNNSLPGNISQSFQKVKNSLPGNISQSFWKVKHHGKKNLDVKTPASYGYSNVKGIMNKVAAVMEIASTYPRDTLLVIYDALDVLMLRAVPRLMQRAVPSHGLIAYLDGEAVTVSSLFINQATATPSLMVRRFSRLFIIRAVASRHWLSSRIPR